MSGKLKNIIWMGEELDFELSPDAAQQAVPLMLDFLESAGGEGLNHKIKAPSENLPLLEEKLEAANEQDPFTTVIDLTRGKISERLGDLLADVPVWTSLSVSRVRQATKPGLPTSGHIVSHAPEEIREVLTDKDLSNVLVLDDTSFSGNTSLIVERLIEGAMPERLANFMHGFLILNHGWLGPNPGATHAINAAGSRAVGGMEMMTPMDDGWHFFDLVKHENLPRHLAAAIELAKLATMPNFDSSSQEFLADQGMLEAVFPNIITTDELECRRVAGRFIASRALEGEFHVTNPQLMPNIVKEGHLLPVSQWRKSEAETLETLLRIGELF